MCVSFPSLILVSWAAGQGCGCVSAKMHSKLQAGNGKGRQRAAEFSLAKTSVTWQGHAFELPQDGFIEALFLTPAWNNWVCVCV